jgi:ubiquinone/menaquinone biosynthesis C-methylase UbiE
VPSTLQETHRHFLPAAGRDFFLPLYDPLVRLLGGDKARMELMDQAALRPAERVLDVGCGTGSLGLALKRRQPSVDMVALDPDPHALALARRKSERAGVAITFDQGYADGLPYPDDSFDRVFSSFMFHHLQPREREGMLREVRRVLKPGGVFHLLDFEHRHDHERGLIDRLLHSSPTLHDNTPDRILAMFDAAGFAEPRRTGGRTLLVGSVAYYRASEPRA